MNSGATEVTWHSHLQRPRGCVVWMTGLSGSGKSTIAHRLDLMLHEHGASSFVLDGDNLRHGISASQEMLQENYGPEFAKRFGLGFANEDREENIRRVAAVAELFCSAGLIAIVALVSPFRRDRDLARKYISSRGSPEDFLEVHVATSLAECQKRDPKGLYRRAATGEIKGMTGIDAPYEPPESPELVLAADQDPSELCAQRIWDYLRGIHKVSGDRS